MKLRHLLLGMLVSATALAASDAIYLPNIPGNATGTSSGAYRGLDVAIMPGGGTQTEDAVHASGATGFMSLCVRNDAGTAVAADGDYIPCTTDSSGALWVRSTEVATAADGGALPALTKVVSGYDGSNVQALHTDSSGDLQIDVLSSALPTGAATSALQTTGNTSLSNIEGLLTTIDADTSNVSSQMDVALSTRASESTLSTLNGKVVNNYGAATGAVRTASQVGNASGVADFGAGAVSAQTLRTIIASDQTAIPVTDNGGALTVDGTVAATQSGTWTNRLSDGTDVADVTAAGELEVSLTTALPAGTNNIGDVDVLTQPARSHSTDSIRIGDGTDLANVTASNALVVDGSAVTQPVTWNDTQKVQIEGTTGGDIGTTNILGVNAMNVTLVTSDGAGIGADGTELHTAPTQAAEATDSTAASATGAAESEAAPADAVGFLLSADGANTDSIRWRIGGTASATAGHELEPGRDSGYIPAGVNLSIFAVSGTQTYQLTWIRR